MKNFAFIFARKDSKRLKNKNTRKLNGKPLIMYSIETAKNIKEISRIFVSSNDPKIKKIAIKNHCIVIDRPEVLAKDNSPEWKSWKHAVNFVKNKYNKNFNFISIPPTAPIRSVSDVRRCIQALDKNIDIVITLSKSNLDPNFNMVMKKGEKVITFRNNKNNYSSRKNSRNIYSITTVAFVSRPDFILKHKNCFEGRVKGIVIPQHRAVDIDDEFDFSIAKIMLKQNRN